MPPNEPSPERFWRALLWIIPTSEQAETLARELGSYDELMARHREISSVIEEWSEKRKRREQSRKRWLLFWQIVTRAGGLIMFISSILFGMKGAGWLPW